MKTVQLCHGNGGIENGKLIKEIFYKYFQNDILDKSEDSAILNVKKIAFTTDSYTVNPIFFSGGDIGKLSVCGTCNDLAVMGARPLYLSISFIIEEGFLIEDLEKIVKSIAHELEKNGALIVTGDTKVVPKGSVDKIFINTTGIGELYHDGLSANTILEDVDILVSNCVGTHGAVIFANREGIEFETDIKSDCASLWSVIKKLIDEKIEIYALRDTTRGGLAAVLNEWANQSNIGITIKEENIPILDEVRGICELLGFEAYNLANEGAFVCAVSKRSSQKAVEILREFEISKYATIIGETTKEYQKKVILSNSYGTKRFLEMPSGELLPRIC